MTRRIIAAALAVALALLGVMPPGAGRAASPPATSPVVQIPAGNDVTAGTPGDAAYAGSGSATLAAALKGIYAALQGLGTAANQAATQAAPGASSTKADGTQGVSGGLPQSTVQWFSEAVNQSLSSGGANLNGAQHATSASGANGAFGYFTVSINTNAAVQIFISNSYYNQYFSVSAGGNNNSVTPIKVPVTGPSMSAGIIAPSSGTATVTFATMLSAN